MITLYQFATSPFTEKVVRALHYKGLDYEVVEVARAKVPEGAYSDVSPTGKFPAIVDDGVAIWDSTDILHHLESKYAAANLIPSDPRHAAIAHAIEDWADESLYFYEILLRLSWEHNLDGLIDKFAATMPGVPKDQVKTMILEGAKQLTQTQGVGRKPRDQVIKDVERHFSALDAMLEGRDWLVGDSVSIADLAVIGQLNALLGSVEGRDAMARTTNLAGWIERLDTAAPQQKPG